MDLDLHWWVRLAHVLAATLLVGGALLTTALVLQPAAAGPHDDAATLAIAEGYEWLFWIAAAIVIATGIGNLGAFGLGLPAPGTRWGRILDGKLLLLGLLLLFSIVRTLVVVRTREGAAQPSRAVWRWLYGITALLAVAIVGYAEALAHG